MRCCYLKNFSFFLSNCWSSQIQSRNWMKTCDQSKTLLLQQFSTVVVYSYAQQRIPFVISGTTHFCWSPLCLWTKVLPNVNYISHKPKCILLWSCSSQHNKIACNEEAEIRIGKWHKWQCSKWARWVESKSLNAWALINVQRFATGAVFSFHVNSVLCILFFMIHSWLSPTRWGVFMFHVLNSSSAPFFFSLIQIQF